MRSARKTNHGVASTLLEVRLYHYRLSHKIPHLGRELGMHHRDADVSLLWTSRAPLFLDTKKTFSEPTHPSLRFSMYFRKSREGW